MAVTKEKKGEMLESYLKMLSNAQGLVIAEYRGMRMKNFNLTRAAFRGVKGSFNVTKNTLLKIALREMGFAVPEDLLIGPTAIAVAYGDLSALTRAVMTRAKEDELLILKGAIMGQTVFRGAAQIEVLSTLPTLSEARASLIGTLQQPASRIIGLLSQPAQGLAAILKAFTDQQQEGSAA